MKNTIEQIICKFGFGMSVKELASRVHRELSCANIESCILNDRYIVIGSERFQLLKTRSKGRWTVREF